MSKELYAVCAQVREPVIGLKSCKKAQLQKVFVKRNYYERNKSKIDAIFKTSYVLDHLPSVGKCKDNFRQSVVGFK